MTPARLETLKHISIHSKFRARDIILGICNYAEGTVENAIIWLHKNGFVEKEKHGSWPFYSITNKGIAAISTAYTEEKEYFAELGKSSGSPIPPSWLNTQQRIAWGTGYIEAKNETNKS